MKKELLDKLCQDVKFRFQEKEILDVMETFDSWLEELQEFHRFDVKGTLPMYSCLEMFESNMREDVPEDMLSVQEVLKNSKSKQDYVLYSKVVDSCS